MHHHNYGFVPRTLCPGGDPLDVLVIMQETVAAGCFLRIRPIGILHVDDRDRAGDDQLIIAVHAEDLDFRQVRELADLPEHRLREIKRFFWDYKGGENEERRSGAVQAQEMGGREEALQVGAWEVGYLDSCTLTYYSNSLQ